MVERGSRQRRQVGRQQGESPGRGAGQGPRHHPEPRPGDQGQLGRDLYTARVWQVEATYLVNGVYRTHTKRNMTLTEMEEWKRHLACEVETCVQAIGGRMS